MEWKPSLEHFNYLLSREWIKLPSNLDYCIEEKGENLYIFYKDMDRYDWFCILNFFPETVEISPRIKAHRGILKQFDSIKYTILDYLYSGKIKNIYVTGYSLGGALTIATLQLLGSLIDEKNLDVKVSGIAYNCPRFFNYNRKLKRTLRDRLITVRSYWDLVCHLPFKITFFPIAISFKPFKIRILNIRYWLSIWQHYGKVIWIGKPWRILPYQHLIAPIRRALKEKFD